MHAYDGLLLCMYGDTLHTPACASGSSCLVKHPDTYVNHRAARCRCQVCDAVKQYARAIALCADSCCLAPAGLPNNDQLYFCPANGSSCYFYVKTSLSFDASKAACRSRGGNLVSYNTGGLLA